MSEWASQERWWDGNTQELTGIGTIAPSFRVTWNAETNVQSKLWVSDLWIEMPLATYKSMLPMTIAVTINGTTKTYSTNSASRKFEREDAAVVEIGGSYGKVGTAFVIPNDGTPFNIVMTVTPKASSGISAQTVTLKACGTIRNGMTGPTGLAAGVPSTYTFTQAARAGDMTIDGETHSFISYLTGAGNGGNPIGYINNGYTSSARATAPYSSATIVPVGPMQEDSSMLVILYTYYETPDFYVDNLSLLAGRPIDGGIIISATILSVNYSGGSSSSSYFTPQITASDFTISGTPSIQNTLVNATYEEAYIANVSSVTVELTGGVFPYGGSFGRMEVLSGNYYVATDGREFTVVFQRTYTAGDTGIEAVKLKIRVYDDRGSYTATPIEVTVPLLKYTSPRISSFTVHRCNILSSSTGADYTDNSDPNNPVYAEADDFGDHCAIITKTVFQSFTSTSFVPALADENTGHVDVNPQNGAQAPENYSYNVPTLNGYTYCKIVEADKERAFDVYAYLSDKIYYDSQQGGQGVITYNRRVSTAGVLMDFLREGKGLGIGMVASTQKYVDVAPDWTLRAYNVVIGNYEPYTPAGETPQAGSDQNLQSWMREVEQRIQALSNS